MTQPRKTVSDIFREHGYPPMDDERRAQVEATRLRYLSPVSDEPDGGSE